MRLLATGRKTEIRKLNVTTTVKEDVVRLDITISSMLVYFHNKFPHRTQDYSPMQETKLVNSLDSHYHFRHVESCNVLREDFILDQHGHQITTRQEFHQQVKVSGVLERGVQLDQPRVVLGVGKNVTLRTDVGQLVLLEHLSLDERLESVDLAIGLPLHQLDLTKCTLSDNLDCLEVVRGFLGPEESKEVGFPYGNGSGVLTFLLLGHGGVTNKLVQVRGTNQPGVSVNKKTKMHTNNCQNDNLPHVTVPCTFNVLMEKHIDQLLGSFSTLVNIF